MTALDIARKDFADALRSRAIWFAVSVFVLVLVLGVSIPLLVFDDPAPSDVISFSQNPATSLLLPIIAVMLGYRSIVGERERGNARFLLSFPHSRSDVVIGKVLGRSSVLAVAILAGFLAVAVLVATFAGTPPIRNLLAFTLVTLYAGSVFVAIAVGVSGMASTGTRAISILVGWFVLATSLWEHVPSGVHYVVAGELPGRDPPWWVHLTRQLNPIEAYSTAGAAVLPATPRIRVTMDNTGVAADRAAGLAAPDSVFFETWFAVAVLACWFIVPLAVGYLRFRTADLT